MKSGAKRRAIPLVWVFFAVLLAGSAVVGSHLAARSVARSDANGARQAFQRTSVDVAARLRMALRLQDGLAVSGAAFLADDPSSNSTDLRRWLQNMQAFERYPELSAAGMIQMVPQSGLAAFAKRVRADTALSPGGQFEVSPPGEREYYCLPAASVARDIWAIPSGLDLCAYDSAGPVGPGLLQARDTGERSIVAVTRGSVTGVLLQAPVYRGGGVPATLSERRSAFLGTFSITTDADSLLDTSLQGTSGIAAALRYRAGTAHFDFSVGAVPSRAQTQTIDLSNGWSIDIFARTASLAVLGDAHAMLLLVVGSLAGLAAGMLILVLSSSRSRAIGLVQARTEQLRQQALHDVLTGLPNRALILDRVEHLLARAKRHDRAVAALFLDVDGFKGINDSLGHAVGDQLLISVADRLRTAVRDADSVGRIGGDEFIVLLDDAALDSTPQAVAQRLLDAMNEPFELEGADVPLHVSISVGIAFAQSDRADELLRDADTALYQAKSRGKNRCEMFHPDMESARSRRLGLDIDLRSALSGGRFELYYQPIYSLKDLKIVGAEALLRWNHPTLGLIGPDQFVPTLERTGQIDDVGRWVLHEACRQVAAWHERGMRLAASVNVSALQLDDERVIADVASALQDSGLPPEYLTLEITETALMRDVVATNRRLYALKKLRVGIAIDDFGTGHSSLAYLHQFPVDYLKIDRMFIRSINEMPGSVPLIISLVYLARSLGLTTIAEGVQTPRELDTVRALKVDQAQGFLFSRPVDAATFEAHLSTPASIGALAG